VAAIRARRGDPVSDRAIELGLRFCDLLLLLAELHVDIVLVDRALVRVMCPVGVVLRRRRAMCGVCIGQLLGGIEERR
jgi:hypothetical protein